MKEILIFLKPKAYEIYISLLYIWYYNCLGLNNCALKVVKIHTNIISRNSELKGKFSWKYKLMQGSDLVLKKKKKMCIND